MAIASLVLGIASLVFLCTVIIPIPASIVSIILGAINIKEHKGGKGMAIAGIVLSCITLFFLIMIIVAIFIPYDGESIIDLLKNQINSSYY